MKQETQFSVSGIHWEKWPSHDMISLAGRENLFGQGFMTCERSTKHFLAKPSHSVHNNVLRALFQTDLSTIF